MSCFITILYNTELIYNCFDFIHAVPHPQFYFREGTFGNQIIYFNVDKGITAE